MIHFHGVFGYFRGISGRPNEKSGKLTIFEILLKIRNFRSFLSFLPFYDTFSGRIQTLFFTEFN